MWNFLFLAFQWLQGQTGFCDPVLGVSGLSAVRGRTSLLNGI
jgi:hypothetical protein